MPDSFPAAPGGGGSSFPRGHEPRDDAPTQDAGALIFRRYRVIRELGRGGMGVVLLAHDTALEIPVAVKLVPDLMVKDAEAIAELRKEVLRGMALTHSGIVRTHNFEKDESGAGIVMEYVEGDTLNDIKVRQPGGCFDPGQILPWMEQLCAVLDYAHAEARIVHRDLKPRNLMLTKTGKLKVADFGIAATLSDTMSRHSMEGVISGTLSYMSPQQAEGKRPTHLDDIHALSATIYELLTGKPPFFRGNPASIHAQILSVVPPSMVERREELEVGGKVLLPSTWEEVIASCLAKDPMQRPQSAGEVVARLKGDVVPLLRRTTAPSAPRGEVASPSRPSQLPSQRSTRLGWSVLVAMMLGAGAVCYFTFERSEEQAQTAPITSMPELAIPQPEPRSTPSSDPRSRQTSPAMSSPTPTSVFASATPIPSSSVPVARSVQAGELFSLNGRDLSSKKRLGLLVGS